MRHPQFEKNLRRKRRAHSHSAKGKTLLKDEKASVCGAVCVTKDGEVVIKAQKVILCTGGFAGNDEMVEKYYPGFKRDW